MRDEGADFEGRKAAAKEGRARAIEAYKQKKLKRLEREAAVLSERLFTQVEHEEDDEAVMVLALLADELQVAEGSKALQRAVDAAQQHMATATAKPLPSAALSSEPSPAASSPVAATSSHVSFTFSSSAGDDKVTKGGERAGGSRSGSGGGSFTFSAPDTTAAVVAAPSGGGQTAAERDEKKDKSPDGSSVDGTFTFGALPALAAGGSGELDGAAATPATSTFPSNSDVTFDFGMKPAKSGAKSSAKEALTFDFPGPVPVIGGGKVNRWVAGTGAYEGQDSTPIVGADAAAGLFGDMPRKPQPKGLVEGETCTLVACKRGDIQRERYLRG